MWLQSPKALLKTIHKLKTIQLLQNRRMFQPFIKHLWRESPWEVSDIFQVYCYYYIAKLDYYINWCTNSSFIHTEFTFYGVIITMMRETPPNLFILFKSRSLSSSAVVILYQRSVLSNPPLPSREKTRQRSAWLNVF